MHNLCVLRGLHEARAVSSPSYTDQNMDPLHRIPPQSIEAERALLGAIMLRNGAIYDASDYVSADSFYVERHRLIFRTMLELAAASSPIDLLSVGNRLKETSQLALSGGNSYLAELVGAVPSSANLKYYAEIVQKKAMMRGLIEAAADITELGYDEAQDIETLLDGADKRMSEVTSSPTMRKFIPMKDMLHEAWERFEKLHGSEHELRGVPSGFPALDSMLAGFQPADLIILAARPSMGKTALALDIARQSATKYGTPVGIFSLEMSSQQLVDRMLSAEARVNAWKLRTGKIDTDEEFERVRDAMETLSKAPIFIDDQPATNAVVMRSVARRLKREHGIGLLVVDYLQLMSPTGARSSDSLVQQVTEISRSLKTLARELEVPVLALSQLSRAVEQRGGKPRLSDLRDSGSIEQDADVVMFIHREDKKNPEAEKTGMAEILVEKHRNGPVGKVDLYFDERRATFLSVDKSDFGGSETPHTNF